MNTFTQNSPVLRVLTGAACCVIILAGMKAIPSESPQAAASLGTTANPSFPPEDSIRKA